MKFTIKQVGSGSERICKLTESLKCSCVSLETPTASLLTQGGSVVHITAEVLSKIFSTPQLLWIPLSNTYPLEAGLKEQGEGVAKFVGLPDQITCLTFNNLNDKTPAGHFEQDNVPLWTKHGKKMISAERYMDMMEIFKPHFIIPLADNQVKINENHKRLKKSIDRTCNLLDICVERYKKSEVLKDSSLFGVITATGLDKGNGECIKNILKHKDTLHGIILSGISDGSDESYDIAIEKLEEIFTKMNASFPKDFLRIVEGCWNPAVIMSAINQGWDIFDGSYPLKLTNSGQALTLNLDINQCSDQPCILDLNDERYKEEFTPILSGCECLACKKHTRAYIRHLLNTKEMLSSVLLSIHNLHHFDQLFIHARRHIEAKTFPIYKKHITSQYELYASSQKIKSKDEQSNVTGPEKIKKKRLSTSDVDISINKLNGAS